MLRERVSPRKVTKKRVQTIVWTIFPGLHSFSSGDATWHSGSSNCQRGAGRGQTLIRLFFLGAIFGFALVGSIRFPVRWHPDV
jgi:hypothetical protein